MGVSRGRATGFSGEERRRPARWPCKNLDFGHAPAPVSVARRSVGLDAGPGACAWGARRSVARRTENVNYLITRKKINI